MNNHLNTNDYEFGYIYLRSHISYQESNIIKVGKTTDLVSRDCVYATGEEYRGKYEIIYKFKYNILNTIDNHIKKEFKKYNHYKGGSTELFKIEIIDELEDFFKLFGYEYTKLSIDDIEYIYREINSKINQELDNELYENNSNIIPRKDQIDIINKCIEYFKYNSKGILVLCCGYGKTIVSLLYIQKMQYNTILIGVPNITLLNQWENVIKKFFKYNILLIFNNKTIKDIKEFINNNDKYIIISTYHASSKIKKAFFETSTVIDIKILDECHHVTTTTVDNNKEQFVDILNIPSKKQLSLTATLKMIENNINTNKVVSNDNTSDFGDIIDKKSLLWGIKNNIICDYIIQTIIADDYELNDLFYDFKIINDNDKRLFLSAYNAIQSINNKDSHHLLIYSNNINNANKINKFINNLLNNNDNIFKITNIFNSTYNSSFSITKQKNILDEFINTKYGIISCVYCLGEGWDLPLLDGIVFAENMESTIRIIQSALRPCRKNINNPNKISKIILPILNINNIDDKDNLDLLKVNKVLYKLGTEDNTINYKIKIYKITNNTNIDKTNNTKSHIYYECDSTLKEQFLLKTIPRALFMVSYEKAKKILQKHKLKSKEDYYTVCKNDNRLPLDPKSYFKNKFINWIDYLDIPNIYYGITECKEKIKHYSNQIYINYLDLFETCKQLNEIDNMFPCPDIWTSYYKIDNITVLFDNKLSSKKKSQFI